MECITSACRMAESPALVSHGEAWLKKMGEVVKMLHQHGYVHGDLRLPNFIVDGERLLLIDFDWGGQEGQATFPDIRLHPILRKGRGDMLIRKHHDEAVLEDAKELILREIELQKLEERLMSIRGQQLESRGFVKRTGKLEGYQLDVRGEE